MPLCLGFITNSDRPATITPDVTSNEIAVKINDAKRKMLGTYFKAMM